MKPGQIFELPNDYMYPPGHIGRILDRETNKKIIAKYEVVEVEKEVKLDKPNDEGELIEIVKELKGRVIVTYGNKRRSNEGADHRRVVPAGSASNANKAG